jgi:hypothetical protein
MSKQEAVKPELIKTLKIDEKTHERLKNGESLAIHMEDSFEDIINTGKMRTSIVILRY